MTNNPPDNGKMKIYEVKFDPLYPVPCGLIISANDLQEAEEIAEKTIKHTDHFTIDEVDISEPTVIFYESGDY